METVGVRELKNNLSKYLKRVKSGSSIVITDRKKEIATIVPKGNGAEGEEILALMQTGLANWSGEKPRGISMRVVAKGWAVSDAVLQDRR